MTTVLLIRHGQASFGSGDYDRLCPQGVRQAALVGALLRRERRLPDVVISGSLHRQVETCTQAMASAGCIRDVEIVPAFDEYPGDVLIRTLLPTVLAGDPDLAAAGDALRHDRRLFQRALTAVLDLWLDGASCPAESWSAFKGRVSEALAGAVRGRGTREVVAVFTSGGVIGAALGEVLGLAPRRAMALSWRVHNASVTELSFGRSGFALVSFNAVGHLRAEDEALLTFR